MGSTYCNVDDYQNEMNWRVLVRVSWYETCSVMMVERE